LKKYFFILIIIILLFSSAVNADRGSIPFQPYIEIMEPKQDALIAWNGEEEILILSTQLAAEKKTKVLEVLPLPSEPLVTESSREIIKKANQYLFDYSFNEVNNIQRPLTRSALDEPKPAGEITQEVVIGSHEIAVAKVIDSSGFVDWVNDYLKSQGNDNPVIPPELQETVKNYIDKGYNYFVFDIIEVSEEANYNEAISYQFKTDKLYYPLEITKSDKGISEIDLIILTDQRLLNFKGIKKERVKTSMGPAPIKSEQIADISEELADLFKGKSKTDNNNYKTSLVSWKIKDDLANFHTDLLVDSNINDLEGKKIEYNGTTYLNCYPHPDYPFSTEKEIEYLNGEVETRTGSRMYPWRAYAVNGKVLFNAESESLIKNFDALGDNITIKGYSAKGTIFMRNPFDQMMTLIEIENAFFVTEIIGWEPYTGLPLNDYGHLSERRIEFWLEK